MPRVRGGLRGENYSLVRSQQKGGEAVQFGLMFCLGRVLEGEVSAFQVYGKVPAQG